MSQVLILGSLLTLLSLSEQTDCLCDSATWLRQPRLYLNTEELLAPTCYGFSLVVSPTDTVVSETILASGSWQPQLVHLVSQLVSAGDIVVNLGAHVGLEALLMGQIVRNSPTKKGHIYAFEPYSASYRLLVKNVFINGLEDVISCYRLAVGSNT